MAKCGENIYKRKDGRWEGRFIRSRRENGHAIYGYVYGRLYRMQRQIKGSRHSAASHDVRLSSDGERAFFFPAAEKMRGGQTIYRPALSLFD